MLERIHSNLDINPKLYKVEKVCIFIKTFRKPNRIPIYFQCMYYDRANYFPRRHYYVACCNANLVDGACIAKTQALRIHFEQ